MKPMKGDDSSSSTTASSVSTTTASDNEDDDDDASSSRRTSSVSTADARKETDSTSLSTSSTTEDAESCGDSSSSTAQPTDDVSTPPGSHVVDLVRGEREQSPQCSEQYLEYARRHSQMLSPCLLLPCIRRGKYREQGRYSGAVDEH